MRSKELCLRLPVGSLSPGEWSRIVSHRFWLPRGLIHTISFDGWFLEIILDVDINRFSFCDFMRFCGYDLFVFVKNVDFECHELFTSFWVGFGYESSKCRLIWWISCESVIAEQSISLPCHISCRSSVFNRLPSS